MPELLAEILHLPRGLGILALLTAALFTSGFSGKDGLSAHMGAAPDQNENQLSLFRSTTLPDESRIFM